MDFHRRLLSCDSLRSSRALHALLLLSGQSADILLATDLLNLYSRLRDLPAAALLFNQIPKRNIFSYNSMISSFVRHGFLADALLCFRRLLAAPNLRPDPFTFPVALKSCADEEDVKKMHSLIKKLGFGTDIFVSSSLISSYSKFGSVECAEQVFDEMPLRDSGCWNAMVSALSQNGREDDAVQVFNQMVRENTFVDKITISTILPSSSSLNDLLMGMSLHVYSIKNGIDSDIFVSNALIDMYSKLSCLDDARRLFDRMSRRDLVTWNTMIASYEQSGDSMAALNLFASMKKHGSKPDALTLVALSSSFARLQHKRNCHAIHGFFVRRGWDEDDIFIGNAIIDMYGKTNMAKYAHKVFDGMRERDVISWNSLITTYSQNGLANEAIEAYESMGSSAGLKPVQGTFASVLPACAHLGALRKGTKIHGEAVKAGSNSDVIVGTCLVDMYAKCGRLVDATNVFVEMPKRTTPGPWNAIIAGNGSHGKGERATELFLEMEKEGVEPDGVTFVSLLSAFSHSGLVQLGRKYFQKMKLKYGIEPMVKHYACMVDLLGRAGLLNEAHGLIEKMPLKPDSAVWGAFLAACRIHGNVELGKLASKWLFEFDSQNAGYYVLLSNLYAKNGEWEAVDKLRSVAKQRGLLKTPGWSSIEVGNEVNVFFTGDQSDEKMKREMVILMAKMKEIGYVPDFSFVLQDVEDDEKEQILGSHSERLAVAFGIVSTVEKSDLFIFKNLRVCGDCHNATKYISRITGREIVVRDSNRFHHFKEGNCSCGDYW